MWTTSSTRSAPSARNSDLRSANGYAAPKPHAALAAHQVAFHEGREERRRSAQAWVHRVELGDVAERTVLVLVGSHAAVGIGGEDERGGVGAPDPRGRPGREREVRARSLAAVGVEAPRCG